MEAITKIEPKEVALSVDDVKRYIAPNASDKELFLFMNIARSYQLNPFKREIHFIKYGTNAASIVVGYETYLKRAERTGKLDGWKCWIEKDEIGEKAVIEIKRKDQNIPIRWEVYRKEFDKGQSVWKQMGTFMLKKVAISQGFRLAFPEDLGGMPYIPEEINEGSSEKLKKEDIDTTKDPIQHLGTIEIPPTEDDVPYFDAENNAGTAIPKEDVAPEFISEAQQKRIFGIAYSSGKKRQQVVDYIKDVLGFEHMKEIPKGPVYDSICKWAEDKEGGT